MKGYYYEKRTAQSLRLGHYVEGFGKVDRILRYSTMNCVKVHFEGSLTHTFNSNRLFHIRMKKLRWKPTLIADLKSSDLVLNPLPERDPRLLCRVSDIVGDNIELWYGRQRVTVYGHARLFKLIEGK